MSREKFDQDGGIAFLWHNITFWGVLQKSSEKFIIKRYEAYSHPSIGYTFRLRRSRRGKESAQFTSGWVLEGFSYSDKRPIILNEHTILRDANFEELISVMAVFVTENVEPWIWSSRSEKEISRLKGRWKSWMKNPPSWAKEVTKEEASTEQRISRD